MVIEHTDEGIIVRLPERFFHASSDAFLSSARREIETGAMRIIIDFKDTVLIDSSAIGTLVSVSKETRTRGMTLLLRNLNEKIFDLFTDTGLDKIFNIESKDGIHDAEIDIFEKAIDIRLEIKKEAVGDVCIFHLSGVLTHPQGSRYFKQQFLLALEQHKKIALDLDELTFFDSLSISVVLSLNNLVTEMGGSLRIYGANHIIAELFDTLAIGKIIPIFDNAADALDDLK